MTEPFLGEIQQFGFNFAPRNWASCNGAVLSIQQNSALFSLLGIQYGGNGTSTFQLPNLMNRAACSQGSGGGLTPRIIGQAFGDNSVSLDAGTMPMHSHPFTVYNQKDITKRAGTPALGNGLGSPANSQPYALGAAPNANFAPNICGVTGNNLPHENRQPYLAVNFCIALNGVFPSFD